MTTTTQTIVDSTVLAEVVLWIKTLKDVGVSPDTAAQVTSQFFLAAVELAGDDEGEEYYDE
jgi:hypothetical protein